ncbi:MAG: hypothetical protein AB7T49_14930 [Oligoflexales bacterium]
MPTMKQLEGAINLATQVKSGLEMLGRTLDALESLIEREHKTIKESDVQALEKLIVEKENISEMISRISIELQKNAEAIRIAYQSLSGTQTNGLTTLTEVVSWLKGIAGCFDSVTPLPHPEHHQVKVLLHLASQIEKVFADVYQKKISAKPKIDMNSHLISKLLLHYRQSIKFWQDVNEESSSVYSQSGVTKTVSQTSSSILRVKA